MAFLDMPAGRSVFLTGVSGRIEEVSSSIHPQHAQEQFLDRQFNDAAAEGPPAIADFTIVDAPPRMGTRQP